MISAAFIFLEFAIIVSFSAAQPDWTRGMAAAAASITKSSRLRIRRMISMIWRIIRQDFRDHIADDLIRISGVWVPHARELDQRGERMFEHIVDAFSARASSAAGIVI